MGELRLRIAASYGESDLVVRFDDHTSVGQLVDHVEPRFDRLGSTPRSLRRTSRGSTYFTRETRISRADLRNGDLVELALDTGLRATAAPAAAATLRVVGGPDAGRSFELKRGESSIGRSTKCDVTLNDDMASRRHAVLRVSDIVEVADAGSTNGILVNGAETSGVHRLRPGDRLLVGDTTMVVDLLGGPHGAIDVTDNSVEFNRPPRIDRPFEPIKIGLPAPLDPPPKQRIPMVSALIPLLMGGVMWLITENIASVAFMALSPLMVLGNIWESRRSGRKDYAERKAEHTATMHDQVAALDQARDEEVRSRFRFSPSNDELLGCVTDLSPRLWERKIDDDDFLSLRVGLREQASQTEIEIGHGGKRDDRRELQDLADSYGDLPPVPVAFNGRAEAPIAVAGPMDTAEAVARSLVLQAATLHSPRDLVICALLTEHRAERWDWLKWLPHTASALGGPVGLSSAVGPDAGIELLASIQEIEELRSGDDTFASRTSLHSPQILVLVDGQTTVERPRFTRLLERGAEAGISFLWLTSDARRVPNACRTVLSIEPGETTLTLGRRLHGAQLGSIPIEPVSRESAEIIARSMAPIVDISADDGRDVDLPQAASLLDLLGGIEVIDSPAAVGERWRQSREGRSLRAPVGVYEGGTLSVDLRVDGPHGLVGGTTGAGKSEFLQAFLTALAASHGPDRITFLLVDYKGGSAFGELVDRFDADDRPVWKGLHHTVGMITDLTPALVRRALVSLRAEVHRREKILNQHRAKDLLDMEKRGAPDTPPSLVIVIDEFAALAREVPDFVEGIVDIAQRGRSLGMHLLLATQRPGGVVTANIQANTNLRVALRMASEDESHDVVSSPIAGRIDRSTPGRGVMRRGPSDLVAFQSAYVGGVTTPTSQATLEVGEFNLGGVDWFAPNQARPGPGPDTESDLKRLVRIINAAAEADNLPNPRRPWLEPLPPLVNLLDLPRPADDRMIPIGLADVPDRQARRLAAFNPDTDGSMLIYGMGGSGKTVVLRSLAATLGLTKNRSIVHVHGLDFAGRGLELLEPLPHVGSIVGGDDYERVTRLLKDLRTEIGRRGRLFADAEASSLSEYRSSDQGDLARIVVLVDGFDNFQATYERIDRGEWAELLPRLVADGRQFGIHFVLTGTRRQSFPMALASQVPSRLVLRLANDDDYHSLGVSGDRFDRDSPPGRCLLGDTEVQVAMLGHDAATSREAAELRRLGKALEGRTAEAPPIRVLPDQLSRGELPPTEGLAWLLTESFQIVGPDLSHHVFIAGAGGSGKTTALLSLHQSLAEKGQRAPIYSANPEQLPAGARSLEQLATDVEAANDQVVFIDDADRLTGSPAEHPLQQAIADGRVIVVVACDSTAARSYDQLLRAIRARADVLVLQPSADLDGDLLGGTIPRNAMSYPRGRGLTTIGAPVPHRVQVALLST